MVAKNSAPPAADKAPESIAPTSDRSAGLVARMAARFSVDPSKLLKTLKATVFKGTADKSTGEIIEATDEELMALLVVADGYGLNPFTREIYAFRDERKGGIIPIVSIDGWLRIINERPELRSIEFEYVGFDIPSDDPASDPYIACRITRSDRSAPAEVREYMRECWRDTGPWKSHARRMLRHKAIIQAGRVAFGFAGIYDHDEAERIRDAGMVDVTPRRVRAPVQAPRALEQTVGSPAHFGAAPELMAEHVARRQAIDDEAESRRLDAEVAAREAGGL